MVLDTPLVNPQHYKVKIKGRVKQSRERSSAPLHLGVEAIKKESFGSPSTTACTPTNSGTARLVPDLPFS